MKLSLFDQNHAFVQHLDFHGAMAPGCVILDGHPYVRDGEKLNYYAVTDVWDRWTRTPELFVAMKLDQPHRFNARTIRWFTGRHAMVNVEFEQPFSLPIRIDLTLKFKSEALIVVNGVWSNEWRRVKKGESSPTRKIANEFTSSRPPGSRLEVVALARDDRGRLVCDVFKHLRAIGEVPPQRLSLKEHLLKHPDLFVPATWRMV